MVVSIVLGVAAILRRDIKSHRAWMTRGYAIGIGAATHMLTLMVGEMVAGPPTELTHEHLMGDAATRLSFFVRPGTTSGRSPSARWHSP